MGTLAWSGAMGDADAASDAPAGHDPEVRLQRALDAAYKYLARRDRTAYEVRRHLEGKMSEPDAIEGAIAELREQGYVDDARYARQYAEDRRSLDGWGPDRIARKLAQAGVDPEHVEAALAGRGRAEELDAAVAVLRSKLRMPPADDRARDRALGMLARRGYDLELAYDAVRAFERDE